MGYVSIIRRILLLESALKRANEYSYRHEDTDIDFEIIDKIDLLKSQLKKWYESSVDKKERRARRNQLKLACRLLNTDFYQLMR